MRPPAFPFALALALTLFAAPTLTAGAAAWDAWPTYDTVVEGHVVYARLEVGDPGNVSAMPTTLRSAEHEGGAAGAITMVRRFPGVLWFNDQFITNPFMQIQSASSGSDETFMRSDFAAALAIDVLRHTPEGTILPCGGAVFVVNQGDPSPIALPDYDVVGAVWGYQTSYLITDPNDRSWVIDEYEVLAKLDASGIIETYIDRVWVSNILGSAVFTPDLGANCAPESQATPAVGPALKGAGVWAPSVPYVMMAQVDAPPAGVTQPDANGYCYAGTPSLGGGCADHTARTYNALVYLPWDRLTIASGPRDHQLSSWTDTNGCHVGTAFRCPADDDDGEGRSHGFAPTGATHGFNPCPPGFTGAADNHGGSAVAPSPRCDGYHATRSVDIYFRGDARPAAPANRSFGIFDTVGSDAPFSAWNPN